MVWLNETYHTSSQEVTWKYLKGLEKIHSSHQPRKLIWQRASKKGEGQIKQFKAKAKGFWKQHVLIQRLLMLIQFRDIKEDVEANTLLINHPLESMIRQNQGQWFAPEVGIKKKVCSR